MSNNIRFNVHTEEETFQQVNSLESLSLISQILQNFNDESNFNIYFSTIHVLDTDNNENNLEEPYDIIIDKLNYAEINKKNDYKDECTICLEKFNNDSEVSILKCNHIFHYDCISKWGIKNNSCPCCRETIPLND
jgi:hypothetical protein